MIKTKYLKLISPSIGFKMEYEAMLNGWAATGEKLVPFVLEFDCSDFEKYIDLLKGFESGIGIPKSFVSHSTFWLIDEQRTILGVSNLRHRLNDSLMIEGGHIGFGIRPSKRKQGYATKILELTLLEAQKMGIQKALVSCDVGNVGSERTILKTGGKFYRETTKDGERIRSFWIEI
jgi:predicted acetyltransferase